MIRSILLSLIFISSLLSLQASNVQVSNISYTGTIGDPLYEVTFDISWENSWRTSTYESNHDAVWVFLKYNTSVENQWAHLRLSGAVQEPSGAELIFPADQTGFFIQRSADGIGDVSFSSVVINWATDFEFFVDETIEICVYAIEMVYIPEGPFYLGDGSESTDRRVFRTGNSIDPFQILSESALVLGGTSSANLTTDATISDNDDFSSVTTQILPAQYPKGFQAFYIMKYEISQGQYAAFLNNVPVDIATERFADSYASGGNTIQIVGVPSFYRADSPERANNYLGWVDIAMYADWAGLRPMSELEYEKACRGPRTPIPNEYAWGTSSIYSGSYLFLDEGKSTETIEGGVEELGNCMWFATSGGGGPKRGGIFAASYDSPSRVQAGASYYGVLELTGNLNEVVINVGRMAGRAFDGDRHGDGDLNSLGVNSWPAIDEGTSGTGTGERGGHYSSSIGTPLLYVSSRRFVNLGIGSFRKPDQGGRLVRSNF